jgi:4-hydroxybenzoate polyprenyltransferase
VKAVGAAGPAAIALGLARLAHPFPSLLNGVAAGAVAVVAGADVAAAGRLGLGMTLLHVSIGALNDVLDAAADAAAGRTAKPIASGLLSPRLGLAALHGHGCGAFAADRISCRHGQGIGRRQAPQPGEDGDRGMSI